MASCGKCAAQNPDTALFCTRCGSSLKEAPPESSALLDTEFDVFLPAGNQRLGPLKGQTVKERIFQGKISLGDSVREKGNETWVPILQSPFREHVLQQSTNQRLAANTCPRCGAGMAVAIKRSGYGLALVILGICLTPVIIGVPIFVVGYLIRWGGKGTAFYQCPRCNYSSK